MGQGLTIQYQGQKQIKSLRIEGHDLSSRQEKLVVHVNLKDAKFVEVLHQRAHSGMKNY